MFQRIFFDIMNNFREITIWISSYSILSTKGGEYFFFRDCRRIRFFFFQLWRLITLEPLKVQGRNLPHFKGLIDADWKCSSSRVWRQYYYLPHPLEKGHFTLKMAKGGIFIFPNCRWVPDTDVMKFLLWKLQTWTSFATEIVFKREAILSIKMKRSCLFTPSSEKFLFKDRGHF